MYGKIDRKKKSFALHSVRGGLHYTNHMKLPLFLLLATLGVTATPLLASQQFEESFSGMVSGPADTNNNGHRDLGDDGAEMGEWTARGKEVWTVEIPENQTEQRLILKGWNASWHPLGRPHGVQVGASRALELSVTVSVMKQRTQNWAWLSDELQNGYGISYGGKENSVRLIKLVDNKTPFGPHRDRSMWVQELGLLEMPDTPLPEQLPEDSPLTLHLRVEQSKSGAPVKLTIWHSSPAGGTETSYESPLLQVTDDGTGQQVALKVAGATPVIDLDTLTWIGISGTRPKDDVFPSFWRVTVNSLD
jgi:hypothetical protein